MYTEKSCLQCGEPLAGRADKKFCDDQCRSSFNYKANSYSIGEMRNINKILRRNRRILNSFVRRDDKGTVSKMKLSDQGFNFQFFTHTYTTRKGTVYKLCYDFGYLPIENDCFMVIKWLKE